MKQIKETYIDTYYYIYLCTAWGILPKALIGGKKLRGQCFLKENKTVWDFYKLENYPSRQIFWANKLFNKFEYKKNVNS